MTDETSDPDPTAVTVRRIIAHLIDAALYAAAFLVPAFLLLDKRDFAPGESLDRLSQADNGDLISYAGDKVYTLAQSDQLIAGLSALAVFVLVAVVLEGLTGRTLGKAVTGIRTVRADGSTPGIFRAFVRSLFWIIDGIPSFVVPLIGGFIALVTTGRRRLGDLVARTYVVHRRFADTAILPSGDIDDAADMTPIDDHPGHVTIVGADEPAAVTDDRLASESAWSADPDDQLVQDAAADDDDDDVADDATDEGAAHADPTDAPATTGDAPTEPKWDPQRKAYISYDPRRGGWMQHDTESGEWVPISTG